VEGFGHRRLRHDEDGTLAAVNLDIKNPNTKGDVEHFPPEQLIEDILRRN